MLEKNKIGKLEQKIEELEKLCDEHKQKLKTHEELLIKATRIIKAMDKTMGPVYDYYMKEIDKKEEEIKSMYG